MKVFIDCGAHKGDISRHFSKRHPDYKMYMFEPNPNLVARCHGSITYLNAVWIKDETLPFYHYRKDPKSEGCTLIKDKSTELLDTENPTMVKAIDFSMWIKNNFDITDKIVVKMDIEGAEYKVLPKMISDASINYINKIYVEWHWKKCGIDKKEHDRIYSMVKSRTKLNPEYRCL